MNPTFIPQNTGAHQLISLKIIMAIQDHSQNLFGQHSLPESDSISSCESAEIFSGDAEFIKGKDSGMFDTNELYCFQGVKSPKIQKMFKRIKREADLIRITMITGMVYIGLLCGTAAKEGTDPKTEDFYVTLKMRGLFKRSDYGEYSNLDEECKYMDEYVRLHWSSIRCLVGISHDEMRDILQSARTNDNGYYSKNANANGLNVPLTPPMMWSGHAQAMNLSGVPRTFPTSPQAANAYHCTQRQQYSQALPSGWNMPNSVANAAHPWMGWWVGNAATHQYGQTVPGYDGHYGYNASNYNSSYFHAQALRARQYWQAAAHPRAQAQQ